MSEALISVPTLECEARRGRDVEWPERLLTVKGIEESQRGRCVM